MNKKYNLVSLLFLLQFVFDILNYPFVKRIIIKLKSKPSFSFSFLAPHLWLIKIS